MTSSKCLVGHACVCGVAVREGNSVAILDACNDYVSGGLALPRAAIYRYDDKPPKGFQVTRDGPGKRFSFNLPSGAHVVADVKLYGLDIFVHTTSEDYGKTSGLCGSYDGNTDNDPDPKLISDINKFRSVNCFKHNNL
ncbi:hypothetical protein LSH36_993g00103 [Paralvinella palmiformis]|uniref:VWFD domain-containing protein n=1 Tax=Paralvinella palmiformis TaxID=53620 RepID=A0AAD9IW88_9ANNE|nr:hypothetical protein LSH36_993g00103 [Paralvinella palmiformis]